MLIAELKPEEKQGINTWLYGAEKVRKAGRIRISRCGRFVGLVGEDGIKITPIIAYTPMGGVFTTVKNLGTECKVPGMGGLEGGDFDDAPRPITRKRGGRGMMTPPRVVMNIVEVKSLVGQTREEILGDVRILSKSGKMGLEWLLGR